MEVYRVNVNGKTFEVEIEDVKSVADRVQEKPDEEVRNNQSNVRKLEPSTVLTKTANNSSAGYLEIKSPMPGKVIAVLASEGQEVASGDVLLKLEAMKMECDIVSPRDGKIKAIYNHEGDIVETDQVLSLLE